MVGFTRVSAATVEMVKGFEGFSPVAYEDRAGKWTIGYGHTMSVVD